MGPHVIIFIVEPFQHDNPYFLAIRNNFPQHNCLIILIQYRRQRMAQGPNGMSPGIIKAQMVSGQNAATGSDAELKGCHLINKQ